MRHSASPTRALTIACAAIACGGALTASAALAENKAGVPVPEITQQQVGEALPGWTAVNRGDGTKVDFEATRTARVLKLTDEEGEGFAGITRLMRDRTQVVAKARVMVKDDGLEPGASRPLILVGGDNGHSQQAGIYRSPGTRDLRWATWRVTPSGRRVDIEVSTRSRVHRKVWQTITFVTNWGGRGGSSLSTGSKAVVGSDPVSMPARGNRVTLALGQASKPGDRGVMLVRRATVKSRGATPEGARTPSAAPGASAKLLSEQEPYAPTFAFNERIPTTTSSDPRSGAIVSQLAQNAAVSKVQMSSAGEVPPVYIAKPSDPFYSVTVGGKPTRFRVPAGVQAGGGSDSPLVILDPNHPDHGRHTELRLWQATVGSGTLSASGAGLLHYNNEGEALNPDKSPSHSIPFDGQGTGSGLSILAGLIRPDEVRLGRINHALRFAYSASDFTSNYRAPATRTDQPNGTSTRNPATAMDMGMRLQLDPAVNCAARTVPGKSDTSAETRYLRMICVALQQYGMIPMDGTADRGILFQMEGDATAGWSSVIGSQHNGGWGYILRDSTSPDDGLPRTSTSGIPWGQLRVLAQSDF
jgi:hypothetical protein